MTAPKITRIAVGNPEIADINLLSNHDFLLVGKKAGTTSLIVWSGNGIREEYSVYVSGEDQGQAKAIQEAIGIPGVQVQMMNGKVLIRGKVKNQYDHDTAMKIAQLYTGSSSEGGDNVVDLMDLTHPTQVRLEAQIIEINADDEKIWAFSSGLRHWETALMNRGRSIRFLPGKISRIPEVVRWAGWGVMCLISTLLYRLW